MKEIRFHGRGGQGAVTAATLLAIAGFHDGKFTQAFPKFGVERRGAPVQAFTRISDSFIRRKSAVYEPDILLVLDPTLTEVVDVTSGLAKDGTIIVNSNKRPEDLNLGDFSVYALDVTKEALETLGLDIVNTGMLGAFSSITGLIKKESIIKAIKGQMAPHLVEKNISLVEKVYEQTEAIKGKNA
ncbi:MAG: pyruvate ferredoxin oxidoreductase subunit gamma [Candidatus Altiarchaeota archaeon]